MKNRFLFPVPKRGIPVKLSSVIKKLSTPSILLNYSSKEFGLLRGTRQLDTEKSCVLCLCLCTEHKHKHKHKYTKKTVFKHKKNTKNMCSKNKNLRF